MVMKFFVLYDLTFCRVFAYPIFEPHFVEDFEPYFNLFDV